MKKISIILLFFLIYFNAYPEASKPIEILADSMEWNKKLGQAIAIGNAKAVQGQTTIKANKIIAILSEGNSQQIKELQAIGKVVFLKDKQIATGDRATYYINEEKVIITGDVELKRDDNIIKGEKLIIDFLSGLSKMEASGKNQKVKMKYTTE